MNRLPFTALFTLISAGACALAACGSLTDPSKGPATTLHIATVTGALTGTAVPDGTHVALVWRTGETGVAVGSDVAVVDGKFTMDLAAPPATYLIAADEDGEDDSSGSTEFGGSPVSTPTAGAGSTPATSASAGTQSLRPLDVVSGTTFSTPLTVAWAGFVVYVDTNGNGKLDLSGSNVETSDTILGGANDLTLTYFAGGGSLDYEKLRDHSGILPHVGYNLSWSTESRWLDLDLVELKLAANVTLPESVCGGMPDTNTVTLNGGGVYASADAGSGGYGGYPSPGDPNVQCSDDGYSWQYITIPTTNCPPPSPPPSGLCADYDAPTTACAGIAGGSISLGPGDSIPPGWPCPVGGIAYADGGVEDTSDGGVVVTPDAGAPVDAGMANP